MCPMHKTAREADLYPSSTGIDDGRAAVGVTGPADLRGSASGRPHSTTGTELAAGAGHVGLLVGSGTVVATLTGVLDIVNAAQLCGFVAGQLAGPDRRRLVVDLTGVGFLAVAGIEGLVRLREQAARCDIEVHTVAVSHTVLRPLQLLGLMDVLGVRTRRTVGRPPVDGRGFGVGRPG